MSLLWILIIILLVVLAFISFGDGIFGASERIVGGRVRKRGKKSVNRKSAKKKPAAKPKPKKPAAKPKKPTDTPAAKKPEAKPTQSKPGEMPEEGWGINDSPACVKQAEDGHKTVMARLSGDYFKNMKVGDKINIRSGDASTTKTIKEIKNYTTFKEMLEEQGVEKVFPGGELNSIDEAIAHYRGFYSEEAEAKRGVIALLF